MIRYKGDSIITIGYAWDKDKKLDISMFYAGGDTRVEFVQEDNGTTMTITYSPD